MMPYLAQWLRGRRRVNDVDLRRNLSYVLHERSDSAAVVSAAMAIRKHAYAQSSAKPFNQNSLLVDEPSAGEPSLILTASVGIPASLALALEAIGWGDVPSLTVDGFPPSGEDFFFRAPARLLLPDAQPRQIAVAGLILRPDGQSTHLRVMGSFQWPDDASGCLRALEALIQPYATQWMPRRSLWDAPAETYFPDEVG